MGCSNMFSQLTSRVCAAMSVAMCSAALRAHEIYKPGMNHILCLSHCTFSISHAGEYWLKTTLDAVYTLLDTWTVGCRKAEIAPEACLGWRRNASAIMHMHAPLFRAILSHQTCLQQLTDAHMAITSPCLRVEYLQASAHAS